MQKSSNATIRNALVRCAIHLVDQVKMTASHAIAQPVRADSSWFVM